MGTLVIGLIPASSTRMIYLDNNATTRIADEAAEAMLPYLSDHFGNPSSAHAAGRTALNAINDARKSVARLVGASSADEIVFTSGGTESDNWAIIGALQADPSRSHIVTTQVEHEAVRSLCLLLEGSGNLVTWLEVSETGELDLAQLEASLTDKTAVVSVMMANNETGVLFPIAEIGSIVKQRSNALFHVDAVNAAGKVAIRAADWNVDLLSISAHKFHGPKGIGALYVREGIDLHSMLIGGGQESNRRAGTEAVHQIVGMGVAADLAFDLSAMTNVCFLRDRLEDQLLKMSSIASVNGTRDKTLRLPNTTNISFENLNGEMILAFLDDAGICVSTGSACNSRSHTASPVLQAMDVPYSKAMGSIRFSLSRYTTADEIDAALNVMPSILNRLAAMAV
ncbi:MAG TPA: aminotransferase class V-fold PLP-dependent enzyme [Pyrinomonadaceae bacterium]|nr:aminotransferase class V-fold PLP-dependent enzyme [Pyrinomonadaceae bacterium]HRK49706.1 aminotransferase class V-fold PLP-dependent enzyme [Pyrinomonadaceae bacterium]